MELQTELVTFKANTHEFRSKEKGGIERIKALENVLASLREMVESHYYQVLHNEMKAKRDDVQFQLDTTVLKNEEDSNNRMMQLEKYKIDLSAMVEKRDTLQMELIPFKTNMRESLSAVRLTLI